MKSYKIKKLLLLFTICICYFVAFPQSSLEDSNYVAFDKLVGQENTNFFNGPEFNDEYPNADGDSRYLNLYIFADSSIEYDGQMYYNVPLEYDVFSDNVITKSNDFLGNFIVQLIPEYISCFAINGHNFVKLSDSELNLNGNGFYEIVSTEGLFELYIKHVRNRKERTVDFAIQHSFSSENFYLIKYNSSYHIIKSIKDFKEFVPDRYKEIQKIRKDYKSLYKADLDDFMVKLVGHLNGY